MIIKRVDKEYVECNKIKLINNLGDNINFNDDIWLCNKKRQSPAQNNSELSLYFNIIPYKYRNIMKYYCLGKKKSINTLRNELWSMSCFFNFLSEEYNSINLIDVNKKTVNAFQSYVRDLDLSENSKKGIFPVLRKFFISMGEYDEVPLINPVSRKNPFQLTGENLRKDERYMSDYVAEQLDKIFLNKNIPLHYRAIYWIMRSIPSRVSEVVGMNINCIKPYGNDWIIIMPTWKENGGYLVPENRLVHIEETGHGKFLLDLIREQQMVSKAFQKSMAKEDKNMLFTVKRFSRVRTPGSNKDEIRYVTCKSTPYIYSKTSVMNMFNKITETFNIKDEGGNAVKFTSHQLRHKGITDRLYAGFSFVEVRDMTGGKDDTVIYSSYYHSVKDKDRIINKKIYEDNGSIENMPIYFSGRIMNLDGDMEKRLLQNPRAYEIYDGEESIGICTDIITCKSNLFECLDCEWFAPKVESVFHYENEVAKWEKKCAMLKNNREALENANYNLSLNKAILARIKLAIEKKLEERLR